METTETQHAAALLSLLFAAGERPSQQGIVDLLAPPVLAPPAPSSVGDAGDAGARPLVSVSLRPEGTVSWLELSAQGLAFDLIGLGPASVPLPPAEHFFGLPSDLGDFVFEAVALAPGPHLAGGEAMLPVVRTLLAIALHLAAGLPVKAVCWHPAGCWMEPRYFVRVAEAWLAGGAFPALGLTAVRRLPDGGAQSAGLAFFTGQELVVEAMPGEPSAETVRLVTRAIDHFVRHGPLLAPATLEGPVGEVLSAAPEEEGRLVRLLRG